MTTAVAISIILPVLLWQGTWFGTRLNNDDLHRYLSSDENARKTQHALVQLTERMEAGDQDAAQFYPMVIGLADSDRSEIRNTTAWVMGWDSEHADFHDALKKLLDDPVLVVRQNAALALTNFDDASSRDVLLSMLAPTVVVSPDSGTIRELLALDSPVKAGMKVATLETAAGVEKVWSPLAGSVEQALVGDGEKVGAGQVLYRILPGESQVFETLRALVRVGREEDIPKVQAIKLHYPSSKRIAQQVEMTIEAIRSR